MRKYFSIFKISISQEFAYRANFIMWRVRNVMQIALVFFLWDSVFSDPSRVVFGYDRSRILTYVFALLVVRAFVLSARAVEVGGEISRGDLSNYLVKPVSYFRYWLTRDFSSKALNLVFAVGETILLYLILRPPIFIQTNPASLFGFLILIILAMLLYFVSLFITSFVPFWMPEAAWGAQFLFMVIIIEFLSGSLFPLDVLPANVQMILSYTPFPYLIYYPIQVYLGNIQGMAIVKGIIVSGIWLIILWFLMNSIWKKGLKVYQSHGR